MQMLYNSENFAVVHIEVEGSRIPEADRDEAASRGGYEIVDKLAGREIFLEGLVAEHFRAGVEALIRQSPSSEDIDDYLSGYTVLAQHPVVLH